MAQSQRIEQRIAAHGYGAGAQFPCLGDSTCQQADAVDKHQLASLACREGKSPDAAQILDADHLGGEDIWNANRIDKIGHGTSRPHHTDSSWCASWVGKSNAYASNSNKPINISAPSFFGVRQIGAAS